MPEAPETPAAASTLEERFHAVFDVQVANFGAYNLVCATGSATHQDPGIRERQGSQQDLFVVGYRRSPMEMVVASIVPEGPGPNGLPVALDNTNTIRCAPQPSGVDLETVSGSVFHLEAPPMIELRTGGPEEPAEILDQSLDAEDFLDFAQQFMV